MRLIDGKAFADEILGEIFERGQASGIWEKQVEIGAITYRDIEFADGYDNAFEEIYRRINNAPTVEAIPVEWIKHWCLKHYPTYPNIITEELLKNTETWKMIDDWEKENETN